MTILGAIIAGGRGRRFAAPDGRGDKGAALLRGMALIDHVAAALGKQTDDLVIVGREWPGLPSVPDRPHAGEGPLGGLCAALHYGRGAGHDLVLCAGCDTLPVPPHLAEMLAPEPAVMDGHWLMGLWPSALADDLARWLDDQSDRSIRGWMAHTHARAVPHGMVLLNINTPETLAEAEALFGRDQSS